MNKKEVIDRIIESLRGSTANPDDFETDNDGMIIVYTDIYRWNDGTYHLEKEKPYQISTKAEIEETIEKLKVSGDIIQQSDGYHISKKS